MLKNLVVRVFRKLGFVPLSQVNVWDKRKGNLRAFQNSASEKEWRQLMMYCEMMYKLEKVPGDIAEFGVAAGISFISFVRILKALERGLGGLEQRKVYGFDSFEGLPDLAVQDTIENVPAAQEMHKGGYAHQEAYNDLVRFTQKETNTKLIKGWFNETVSPFFKENPHTSLAFIHIDCDLYESTKSVLDQSWDRLSPGGIILFDELNHPDFPGETVAFREFFKEKTGQFSIHQVRAMPAKRYLIKH